MKIIKRENTKMGCPIVLENPENDFDTRNYVYTIQSILSSETEFLEGLVSSCQSDTRNQQIAKRLLTLMWKLSKVKI